MKLYFKDRQTIDAHFTMFINGVKMFTQNIIILTYQDLNLNDFYSNNLSNYDISYSKKQFTNNCVIKIRYKIMFYTQYK